VVNRRLIGICVIGDAILDFGFWILDCFSELQSKIMNYEL
jgi:hypothetical protein